MTSPNPISIGRIVHYTELDANAPEPGDGEQWPKIEWPAIVTGVDDAGAQLVTLTVFRAADIVQFSTVRYSAEQLNRSWHWPADDTGGS